MPERRFQNGVIIDLPEGFELVEITTMSDALPRMLVSVDFDSPLWRQILETPRPKEAKCTEQLPLRLPQDLYLSLSKLANAEDRSLSEYCRMVLSLHAFGHAFRLDQAGRVCEECNASSANARNK